jgi:hypothetical protein
MDKACGTIRRRTTEFRTVLSRERAELAWAIHANQGRISRLRASDAARGSLWFAGRLPEHGDSVRDLKRFAHRSAPVQLIHLAVAPALHGLLGATDPTEGLPVRFFRAPYTLVYIAFPRPAGLMQVSPDLHAGLRGPSRCSTRPMAQ